MSFTLNIYGHNVPSDELERASRSAFGAVAAVAPDASGSLSGQGSDGKAVTIVFPEAAASVDGEPGKVVATWSVKVVSRDGGLDDVVVPTNAQLEKVIQDAVVAAFPSLTANATAERTDR